MQNTSLSLVGALITTADHFPTQLIIASSALPPTLIWKEQNSLGNFHITVNAANLGEVKKRG